MDAITLYMISVCQIGPPGFPCSASLYEAADPPSSYTWTRGDCLDRAQRGEARFPGYKVFCIGADGISLDAQGKVMDPKEYWKAVDRWHATQRHEKLSAQ
jgi:hypothetical protein